MRFVQMSDKNKDDQLFIQFLKDCDFGLKVGHRKKPNTICFKIICRYEKNPELPYQMQVIFNKWHEQPLTIAESILKIIEDPAIKPLVRPVSK